MAFHSDRSLEQEMKWLETLSEGDPESAANLVANGNLLVNYALAGNLRALQCAIEHLEKGHVLVFYAVRMFREACAMKRLDILKFLLLNGFDLQQRYMRDILHDVIEGVNSVQKAEAVQPLIRFLLEAGVDVNWQRESDLYTALHVACCKNVYALAHLLILYDADVNAVAADNSLPLTCANRVKPLSEDDQSQNELLVTILVHNQARPCWRNMSHTELPIENASSKDQAAQLKRPILSFSSSFGLSPCSVADSTDNRHQVGLLFDTSEGLFDTKYGPILRRYIFAPSTTRDKVAIEASTEEDRWAMDTRIRRDYAPKDVFGVPDAATR